MTHIFSLFCDDMDGEECGFNLGLVETAEEEQDHPKVVLLFLGGNT